MAAAGPLFPLEAVGQVRMKYETRLMQKDLNPRAPDVRLLDGLSEYVRRPDEASRSLRLMCRMAVPRHCDGSRAGWQQRAAVNPELQAVPFARTPALFEEGAVQ
jgi:hypothetical protein